MLNMTVKYENSEKEKTLHETHRSKKRNTTQNTNYTRTTAIERSVATPVGIKHFKKLESWMNNEFRCKEKKQQKKKKKTKKKKNKFYLYCVL